jgi:hypothetical protein
VSATGAAVPRWSFQAGLEVLPCPDAAAGCSLPPARWIRAVCATPQYVRATVCRRQRRAPAQFQKSVVLFTGPLDAVGQIQLQAGVAFAAVVEPDAFHDPVVNTVEEKGKSVPRKDSLEGAPARCAPATVESTFFRRNNEHLHGP